MAGSRPSQARADRGKHLQKDGSTAGQAQGRCDALNIVLTTVGVAVLSLFYSWGN